MQADALMPPNTVDLLLHTGKYDRNGIPWWHGNCLLYCSHNWLFHSSWSRTSNTPGLWFL